VLLHFDISWATGGANLRSVKFRKDPGTSVARGWKGRFACGVLLLVAARASGGQGYLFNDSHFHLTN